MTPASVAPKITTEEQLTLARNLGVEGEATGESVTIESLRGEVDGVTDPAFASMGESIRRDLKGHLNGALLERERENLTTAIDRLPEIRAAEIPDEPGELYGNVAEPGWQVYDHLVDVGFFESAEENLPRFTPDHIERTARELILADPLTTGLAEVGFDERERTRLLITLVNNATRLGRWVPTHEIPEDVEFDRENVPPLHQRAAGGALLWIHDLDRHFWLKEVLITDEILDDAAWYAKAMLGGLYVMTTAAHDVAIAGELTDGQLVAALTASAAIQIVSQEELMKDVYYITDDMRAPSELR